MYSLTFVAGKRALGRSITSFLASFFALTKSPSKIYSWAFFAELSDDLSKDNFTNCSFGDDAKNLC